MEVDNWATYNYFIERFENVIVDCGKDDKEWPILVGFMTNYSNFEERNSVRFIM